MVEKMPPKKVQISVTFKNRVKSIFDDIKELLKDEDTDENVSKIRKKLGDLHEKPWAYLLAAGFFGRVGLLKIVIKEYPECLSMVVKMKEKRSILHLLLRRTFKRDGSKEKCLLLLLDGCNDKETNDKVYEAMKKIINCPDEAGKVPLHYATRYWNESDRIMKKLLELGGMASIGETAKGELEKPIGSIKTQVLKEFLDDCVKKSDEEDYVPMNSQELKLHFKFRLLAPETAMDNEGSSLTQFSEIQTNEAQNQEAENPDQTSLTSLQNVEIGNRSTSRSDEAKNPSLEKPDPASPVTETEAIWHIGQSSEHSHLLTHPVIGTFVKLKWLKAKSYFRRRVRLLFLFVLILTSEIFNEYKSTALGGINGDEFESVKKYHKRKGQISCGGYIMRYFLFLVAPFFILWGDQLWEFVEFKRKFEKTWPIRKYLFDSSLIGIALIYILIVTVGSEINPFGFCIANQTQDEMLHEIRYSPLTVSHGGPIIIVFLWFGLIFRETIDFIASPMRYFLNEHWIIQLFSLISVAFTLIFKYCFLGLENFEDLRNQFAAFALLSSWVYLVMESAKLSSTINVYVTMLTSIVQTMAMIMVFGSILIMAFASGFYIIWDQSSNDVCVKDSPIFNQTRNEYYRCPFYGHTTAVTKTFTMFSGEIDYNYIYPPFDQKTEALPRLLFQCYLGAFIFFIVIAFNNFLNAVAVSDVALLKQESELINEKQRIDIILSYETYAQRSHNQVVRFLKELFIGDDKMDLLSTKNYDENGFEFSNPTNSKQKWYLFQEHSDIEKVFEFTDFEGNKFQKIGLSKHRFKAIEEVLDGKRKEQDIENKVRTLIADPDQDVESKVKTLLADPCFKKFSEGK